MSSTGISVTDARAYLEAVLDAGGLPVMRHAGQLQAAPGVMIAAADPWLERTPALDRLEYLSRWRLLLVGGAVDLEGILDQLGTMIAAAVQAMRNAGIATDRTAVSGPRMLPRENAIYLTCELIALIPVSLATMPVPAP
jgi:hypothetical protein